MKFVSLLSTLLALLSFAVGQDDDFFGDCRRRLLTAEDSKGMHSRTVTESSRSNSNSNNTNTNSTAGDYDVDVPLYTTEIVLEQRTESEFGWMKDHVEEMQARMHNGDIARAWDPLFQAYFQAFAKGEFETTCELDPDQENRMVCTKTALTECARDLIQGHGAYHMTVRNVIMGNDDGDAFVEDDHAVPESCM